MKFVSIKDRLIMVLMITSLTSIVITSLAYSFHGLQRYKKFKRAELSQIVALLGPQSLHHLEAGNLQQAERWLAILSQQPKVRVAALYDGQGVFFAGYKRESTLPTAPLSIHDTEEHCFDDNVCISIQKLFDDDKLKGFFLLEVDLEDARSGLISIIVIFFLATMVTLLVAYVVASFLHDQFKKPIVSLVDTARFICENKDFKARARKYSSDEMGLLTDTINSMLDEISRREEEMKNLTGQLESRVETRTAALQEINTRLFSEKTRADNAATVKSDFLANMSHEIRTPMNGIVAACDLAMDEDLSPKVANYLKIIQDSSHALLIIVNDILDFSRLEAGTLVLDHSLFSLPDLFTELNDFFSVQAHDENIDLIIDMEPEVPTLLIGDRARFRQILYNLVDNGMKFTHGGMISLYVSCLEKNEQDSLLEIRVRDTGVGLSTEGKERIFSSFHQEDSSSTRQFSGIGLGLAISRQLARMMGGTIEVESELGKGATFIVTVRLGWRENEIDQAAALFTKEKNNISQPVDLAGLHVLVVEDNETNRGVAEAMLTGLGMTVETVENGQEAVNLTCATNFDVILMEMQMPIMDGYQAMDKIRRQGLCTNVPIVAMTAHALDGDKDKCLQAGADGYISKPVHKKLLQAVLTSVLSDKGLKKDEVGHENLFEDLETGAEFIPDNGVIDVEKAIRQLGVREEVYHRVLKTFCHDYKSFRQEYSKFTSENDLGVIQKMVHSLKGSSATVGAETLSQLATEADKICKKKEMPPESLAQKLLTCLDDVLTCAQQIEQAEGESIIEPTDLCVKESGKVKQQLQDLADSLDQSMYDTINKCFERLDENVSGKKIVSLHKLIRMYSYEDALALVHEIGEELGLSLR